MKSAHRHELGTNVLAKRLNAMIEQFRPYASTIAGVIVAIVVVMFIWSYFAGSSSARQSAAWDDYNRSVAGAAPNLEQLRIVAEEHPGTKMQQLANVTWADGQVWMAARDYIYNRSAAMEALTRAEGAYQSVIDSSNDERLVNRAHLGLARIYEMRGDLDDAREAYLKVTGGYEEFAKQQAERLAEPETKETYSWLATARPTPPRAPAGPGVPGRQPEFSAGELALPGAESEGTAGAPADVDPLDKLFEGVDLGAMPAEGADPYAPFETPSAPEGSTPAPEPTGPETSGSSAADSDAAPSEAPASDAAPIETPAE